MNTTNTNNKDIVMGKKHKLSCLVSPSPQPQIISTKPTETDIVLGRGNGVASLPGNCIFRIYIKLFRPAYLEALRNDKVSIAAKVVDKVKQLDPPGRFLEPYGTGVNVTRRNKKNHDAYGLYVEIDMKRVIEKICQALREKPTKEKRNRRPMHPLTPKEQQQKQEGQGQQVHMPKKKEESSLLLQPSTLVVNSYECSTNHFTVGHTTDTATSSNRTQDKDLSPPRPSNLTIPETMKLYTEAATNRKKNEYKYSSSPMVTVSSALENNISMFSTGAKTPTASKLMHTPPPKPMQTSKQYQDISLVDDDENTIVNPLFSSPIPVVSPEGVPLRYSASNISINSLVDEMPMLNGNDSQVLDYEESCNDHCRQQQPMWLYECSFYPVENTVNDTTSNVIRYLDSIDDASVFTSSSAFNIMDGIPVTHSTEEDKCYHNHPLVSSLYDCTFHPDEFTTTAHHMCTTTDTMQHYNSIEDALDDIDGFSHLF